MPVVSNTSPILNLAAIGKLELLKQQFGRVMIPQAALDELRVDEPFPGNERVHAAIEEGWVVVEPIRHEGVAAAFKQYLDDGESEAIALALEQRAELILLDEKDGRATARAAGLTVTGVLGIILRGFAENRLTDPLDAIEQWRNRAGFFVSDAIMTDVAAAIERLSRGQGKTTG